MAEMECPHCHKSTTRLRTHPLVEHIFCDQCDPGHAPRDRKLYTGRKFWHEKDCYTRDELREANHNFEQGVKQKVADNFKHMRKSTRKAIYGE